MHWILGITFIVLVEAIPFSGANGQRAYLNIGEDGSPCASRGTIPNIVSTMNEKLNVRELLASRPWYSYLTYGDWDWGENDLTVPLRYNAVSYFNIVGKSNEPTSAVEAQIITQERIFQYQNGSCVDTIGVFWYTIDGRQIGPIFRLISKKNSTTDIKPFGFDQSIVLATDQSTYILYHNCEKRNSAAGRCDNYHIYVLTSIKPSLLTISQKKTIANAVNGTLGHEPYCLDMTYFRAHIWDNTTPECPRVKRYPASFETILDTYRMLIEDTDNEE